MSEIQTESYEKIGEKLSKGGFNIRSAIISTAGKVLHLIISGGNKSLEETSKKYLKKIGIILFTDDESENNLKKFKNNNKGIIILTHKSGIFSDYLPIFSQLGDNILKNSVFYTGDYNFKMNKREFPDYKFRAVTLNDNKNVKKLISNIENDIKKVQDKGGYIFLIPSGENIKNDGEFKSIFKKIIKGLGNEFPILSTRVNHEWSGNYEEILKNLTIITSPKVSETEYRNTTIGDYKGKNGEEMRKTYNSLFIEKD